MQLPLLWFQIASINVIYEAIDAMSVDRGGRGGVVAHMSMPTVAKTHELTHPTNLYNALSTDQAIGRLMRSLTVSFFFTIRKY